MDTVLFEFKGSKKELDFDERSICSDVERELARFGIENAFVSLCCSSSEEGKEVYLLQRFSQKWNTFVDVRCAEEVLPNDRITVVHKPVNSPKKCESNYEGAQSILKKISKPTKVEIQELSKFFPSYSDKKGNSKAGPSKSFDPGASCIVGENQRKKKAAVKQRKAKQSNITVVLLDKFLPVVPRGKARQKLASKGLMQSVRFTRDMNAQQVRNKICSVFSCSDYTILECDNRGNTLCKCANQDLDGESAVNRKGCLYLCKTFMERDDESGSGQEFQPPTTKKKKLPILLVSSESSSEGEVDTNQGLKEYRRICQEQDEAYAESLKQDRAKDMQRARQMETKQQLEKARDNLKKKWTPDAYSVKGARLVIRLSSSEKMDVSLAMDSSAKALYEISFAFGSMDCNFSLYTAMPRIRVSEMMSIQEVASYSTVVCVEYGNEPIDFNSFIFNQESSHKVETTTAEMLPSQPDELLPNQPNELQPNQPDEVFPLLPDEVDSDIVHEVDAMRFEFMTDDEHVATHHGLPRSIRRDEIYQDVIETCTEDLCSVLQEFPFRVTFVNERAIDTGGVCRDMFSCFWEAAYLKHFDGERLLVPAVSPGVDMAILSTLGTLISHGFLVSGFLPIRIAFPVLASIVCGPCITIPDHINVESFVDYIGSHESSLLNRALAQANTGKVFSEGLKSQLIALLSRFDCTDVPTKDNIRRLVLDVAKHHFLGKPLGVLYTMHAGVPKTHIAFWEKMSVDKWFKLYKAMNATPSSVLQLLDEPEFYNQAEARVFGFLTTFIGNCNNDNLRAFLRFVTGSTVIVDKSITVSFNSLSGLARRPISHTCSCSLELSTSYRTYLEFDKELHSVLSSEASFAMDAI